MSEVILLEMFWQTWIVIFFKVKLIMKDIFSIYTERYYVLIVFENLGGLVFDYRWNNLHKKICNVYILKLNRIEGLFSQKIKSLYCLNMGYSNFWTVKVM